MVSSVKFVVGENITLKCYLEGRNVGYLKMIDNNKMSRC